MRYPFILLLFALAFTSCQTDKQSKELLYNQNDKDWYTRKKGVTNYLKLIAEGNAEAAISHASKQGRDAEACFVKALAYARLQKGDSAMIMVHKSLEWGLSIDRYQGPYGILEPLYALPDFKAFIADRAGSLVHGPMTGHVSSTSAKFWVRSAESSDVQIVLSEDESFKRKLFSEKVRTEAATEFTAQMLATGLSPDHTYYYRVEIDGKKQKKTYSFSTQPLEGEPGELSIAFGGGAAYIPWHSYMWNTLDSHELNAMLLLGDNVYIDYPERPELQRYCYHRRQSKPEFRSFVSGTPILSIWDDHDFGDNDQYGGREIDFPAWKRPVYEVFRNQFANPYYGGGDENPGVWYDFQIADIDFFMLDCRYYREPSSADGNIEDPQMLGEVQMSWLKEKLLASEGTFKVIASSVPWAYGAKAGMAGRFDTWRGYKKERDEIFDFLDENEIEGVILLSADRHRSDMWKIERENGYPLYELESSKLVNTHTHQCMDDPERVLCYNEKCSFGKVIFDTKAADPFLRYEIWSIDNEKIEEYTIMLSELQTASH